MSIAVIVGIGLGVVGGASRYVAWEVANACGGSSSGHHPFAVPEVVILPRRLRYVRNAVCAEQKAVGKSTRKERARGRAHAAVHRQVQVLVAFGFSSFSMA